MLNSPLQHGRSSDVLVSGEILLSSHGSDRATAYNTSNKLVRHNGHLYVGWLDAPDAAGGPTRVQLGHCDGVTGALMRTVSLGQAADNHCGPAFAIDGQHRLHAILGAHDGVMRHRWAGTDFVWSESADFGPKDTYPSMIADMDGTLHLAHREAGDLWQLWHRRKRADGDWEQPRSLAISPVPGYNNFMQSLSVGPNGTLHLTFQFHYGTPDESYDRKGKYGVHLRSDDGGDTWTNNSILCQFPLTVDSIRPFCAYPEGGIRISNHVVDSHNRVWVYSSAPESPSGSLFFGGGSEWSTVDIQETLGQLNLMDGHGREVSLSRTADGRIHLVAATNPDGGAAAWYDPRHELFHLVLTEDGKTESFEQITDTDPTSAHWLPALEAWDWRRPGESCVDGLWLMYTEGLNRGGIGGDNANSVQTAVYLRHLD